ncbi:MAG: metal ABC transporter permease [Alistipes sp.]|nr:metal ABC transporter permease [Alistipes sp.]
MIATIENIFAYDFLVNAFVACILSGITCGIVGSYIVARRMVFLASGITHASFGGLGIALYAGLNPLLGAVAFASVSSLGIEYASRKGRMREDSAIGIIWSVGMAIGALFMSLRPGYATDLTSYLFGNILLVDRGDVAWLALLTVVIVFGAAIWLRRLMYITFDEEYARSQGLPVAVVAYVMAVVIAITIVLSIKVMGIILLLSLVTLPVVIANTLTKDYRRITLFASIIAVVANVIGFIFSYEYDLPTGSCIIFILVVLLAVVKLLTSLKHRVTTL